MLDGASTDEVFIGKVYRGYQLTPQGSFIGLLWALADGIIGRAIVAWLYNLLSGGQVAKQDG